MIDVFVLQHAKTHAILGLVTAGLVVGQVLMGIVRPALVSPRRPVFNWAHRTVAVLTQTIAGSFNLK